MLARSPAVKSGLWKQEIGTCSGTVTEVQFGAGEAPPLLVVRRAPSTSEATERDKASESLIPYAEEFVTAADFEQRRIDMRLPEGLLELEGPLSKEERSGRRRVGS